MSRDVDYYEPDDPDRRHVRTVDPALIALRSRFLDDEAKATARAASKRAKRIKAVKASRRASRRRR